MTRTRTMARRGYRARPGASMVPAGCAAASGWPAAHLARIGRGTRLGDAGRRAVRTQPPGPLRSSGQHGQIVNRLAKIPILV